MGVLGQRMRRFASRGCGHAVRGLMRSYVTRLNGGLSPSFASAGSMLMLQTQRRWRASLTRVINKRAPSAAVGQ